jgi:hypothetical protein
MTSDRHDSSKLNVFTDLMRMMDSAFIHKLRARNPNISEGEVAEELKRWYMHRPGAEHGDSSGVRGDLSRFFS